MKFFICLLLLFLVLPGCRKPQTEDFFQHPEPEQSFTFHSEFELTIPADHSMSENNLQRAFISPAAQTCFRQTAREMLQLQPAVRAGKTCNEQALPALFAFHGEINPDIAALTGDLTQHFSCSMTFFPCYSFAGKIVALEDEKTMAARGDRLYLYLFEHLPPELPVYFMLGRKKILNGQNIISIFGSGQILQVLPLETGPNPGNSGGVHAQGKILETNHEVYSDDLIFIAAVELHAQTELAAPAYTPLPMADEIRVRPRIIESRPFPMEDK